MNSSDEFLQLITEFQGRLFGFVLSLLADADQANEVLQETNLVLWRKWIGDVAVEGTAGDFRDF